jgi:hypothetical protein
MITGVIGFGGFHHSIVKYWGFGALLYSNNVHFLDYISFLGLALFGTSSVELSL